ncbi:hypothetical protein ACQR35_08150 [Pseudarthrobacter sp. J1738]|uniref:hypothetical protein n=1 Tax=Pseudarthrobacter sp. J1738 TaxID=3420446 RepID=UPI003D2DEBD5
MTALWVAVALIVAGFVGWPVTALIFKLARTIDTHTAAQELTAEEVQPGVQNDDGATVAAESAPAVDSEQILRGGAIIGVLERLAVSLAILGGQPVAIAYIVAIKGLGRFAELKETPAASERFIIGTLSSMLWAAGTTALIKVLFLS